MSNVTTIATLREPQALPMQAAVTAGFFDIQGFELMQRVAKAFASSTLVPQQYQGNVANTMIALSMAQRMSADPMMCMQNLVIIHGRPSWSSKFLIATFNACGRFSSMRFRFQGTEGQDDWACQAHANEKATGNEITGSWVSIKMAKDEGWHGKNGSKWKTMPQHMLMYRAASFFVNIYAPELSMGLTTVEEARDITDVSPDDSGRYTVESLRAEPLRAEPEPVAISAPVDPESTAEDSSEFPEWPQANADGELFDVRGIVWIEAAHSANKTVNDDGTWRRKRGVDPEIVARLESVALAPQAEPMTLERILRGISESQDDDTIDEWCNIALDDLTVALDDADKSKVADAAKARSQSLCAG